MLESLRKRFREIPGIAVYMQPVQNLRLGGRQSKARFQYTLQSVNAGDDGRLGRPAHGAACAPTRPSAT